MRFYYRRGGKGAAPEGFDRVYTEVDGDGNVLRELLAYVRADDSVTVEMDGELGGTAGAFVEMALALYRQQATLLCKSPKIDTAAGHWQAVLSDLALLTSRDTGDAARLSRFMEGLHRCFDLVERRQMTVPPFGRSVKNPFPVLQANMRLVCSGFVLLFLCQVQVFTIIAVFHFLPLRKYSRTNAI